MSCRFFCFRQCMLPTRCLFTPGKCLCSIIFSRSSRIYPLWPCPYHGIVSGFCISHFVVPCSLLSRLLLMSPPFLSNGWSQICYMCPHVIVIVYPCALKPRSAKHQRCNGYLM
ncbi:hypothetical protein BD408DRAFT_423991, partial [Parasitella parasitica]